MVEISIDIASSVQRARDEGSGAPSGASRGDNAEFCTAARFETPG
jgi:hypothetical protein